MTESEWLACDDPQSMIVGLKDVASERKARLFLCGGCRTIWDLLYSHHSHRSIEVAERFADGFATADELRRACYRAEIPTFGFDFEPGTWRKWHPDGAVPPDVQRLVEMGVLTPEQLEQDEPEVDAAAKDRLLAAARLAEAAASRNPFEHDWWHRSIARVPWPGGALGRCVFGNPFRPSASVDQFCRTHNDWAVPRLARSMYEARDFARLPELADGLDDAGCRDRELLGHVRGPGPHVRGCWAVDLILGRS